MSRSTLLAHGVLWAAAIVSSALAGAPATVTTVLLPSLAAIAMTIVGRAR